MTNKTITINQFLTDAEIQRAAALYRQSAPGTFAAALAKEIITPNLERINTALGQENDAHYLAYMVEYVFMREVPR